MQACASQLSVHVNDLQSGIARLREEVRTRDLRLKERGLQLFRFWAAEWAPEAREFQGVPLVARSVGEVNAEERKRLAHELEKHNVAALLVTDVEAGVQVTVAVPESLREIRAANELLADALDPIGGKGGGSKGFAQGGASGARAADVLERLR